MREAVDGAARDARQLAAERPQGGGEVGGRRVTVHGDVNGGETGDVGRRLRRARVDVGGRR